MGIRMNPVRNSHTVRKNSSITSIAAPYAAARSDKHIALRNSIVFEGIAFGNQPADRTGARGERETSDVAAEDNVVVEDHKIIDDDS